MMVKQRQDNRKQINESNERRWTTRLYSNSIHLIAPTMSYGFMVYDTIASASLSSPIIGFLIGNYVED